MLIIAVIDLLRFGLFGMEVSRVLGGGLVPGKLFSSCPLYSFLFRGCLFVFLRFFFFFFL